MTVKDVLNSVGSWSIALVDNTPDDVLNALDYFGHVAIVNGPVDPVAVGDAMLSGARYVGVLRNRQTSPSPSIAGVGMIAWAGDEDGKGDVLESKVAFTNGTFSQWVGALVPASLTLGTVYNVPGTYTGSFQFQTSREALDVVCAAFGAEWLVTGDGKLFAGTVAQLYNTTPTTVVSRRNTGTDMDLNALGGSFDAQGDVIDYTTRVLLIGKSDELGNFATGSADAPSVPYRNLFGSPVKRTRMISETGTPVGTVAQRAGLALNRFNRQRRALKVTTERYETDGTFKVGEFAYVFDPESGVFDPARQITFRGEVLHPDVVRISAIGYPITDGHTVGFRRGDGTWIDLTRYVVWESGTNEVTVGDLPQSLGGGRVNVAAERADANAVDLIAPKPPTALDVQTSVIDTGPNGLVGQAALSWTAPTQNADNTSLIDLDGYLVQSKLSASGANAYVSTFVIGTSTVLDVTPGRNYDFRVFALDRNGNRSDPSSTVSKLTVLDTTPPGPPSDPTVSSYIGQLRIAWNGKMSDGSNPPSDFFQVDVHVSDTANFTPSTSTLVSSLLEAGVAFATAPYGSPRYVKLIALDRSGNASAPSSQVTGSTTQVADGDVAALNVGKLVAGTMTAEVTMAGRIATALTGARVEMNGSGFFKVNEDGTFAVAIDGTRALLNGTFMTAASGRRILLASGGTSGQLLYYAPDGKYARILSYTESNGIEALLLEAPRPAAQTSAASYINLNSDSYSSYRANIHEFQNVGSTRHFRVYDDSFMRFQISPSETLFSMGGAVARWRFGNASGANGTIEINPSYNTVLSPQINMYPPNGIGVGFRAAADSGSQQIDIVNPAANVYYSLRASQFLAQSDGAAKTEPLPVSRGDMLAEVLGLRVRRYHRLNSVDENGEPCMNPREEVGFIAQETSDRIGYEGSDTAFVDVYQTLALTVGALQALHRDFDEYRKAHA